MTVCVGLLCTDGVIIGSDTEMSGVAKYHASKLRRGSFEAGEYALTGTGNKGFIGMAADFIGIALRKAEKQFKKTKNSEEKADVFITSVDSVIKRIHDAYIQQPTYPGPDNIPYLELILGVYFKGEGEAIKLMHCAGDGSVGWINHHIMCGSGSDIALRFLTILAPGPRPIEIMQSVAFLCIAEAKLGAEGVSGHSELIQFPHPEPPVLEAWYSESPLLEIAEEALQLAICAPREKLADEAFERRLKTFSDKLRQVKAAVDRIPGSERITLELIRKAREERDSLPQL